MARGDFRALGRHVAELQDRAPEDAAANEALRQRLAERAGARVRAARRWSAPRLLAVAAGVALLVAAGLVTRGGAPEAPLTFTVGEPGKASPLRAWVSAPSASELPIRFSDGSKVTLEPNARARVLSTTPHGAEVVVESGAATADVVPRAKGAWLLRSGPFTVHVTGTRFSASWDAPSDTLTVRLYEGSVRVTGCSLGAGQTLEQGQALEVSCADGRVAISPLDAFEAGRRSASAKADETRPSPVSPLTSTTEPVVPQQPSRNTRGPRARVRQAPVAPTWVELARQARYEEAYRAAVAVGFSQALQRASGPELLLLGDSARLSGSAAHAREAYGAVRRRFYATPSAARAAFHLGQMDSLAGQHASSIAWYRAYLDEMPSGGLAGAALGRIMEARVELGDVSSARSVAAAYLERYPGGAHADHARELLGQSRHD